MQCVFGCVVVQTRVQSVNREDPPVTIARRSIIRVARNVPNRKKRRYARYSIKIKLAGAEQGKNI